MVGGPAGLASSKENVVERPPVWSVGRGADPAQQGEDGAARRSHRAHCHAFSGRDPAGQVHLRGGAGSSGGPRLLALAVDLNARSIVRSDSRQGGGRVRQ